MSRDAFTGGVEPGGLWTQNDIRILLCYILASVDAPLSGESISQIIQGKALANYFEVGDALAALLRQGNIAQDENGLYTVTASGREIAGSLDATLPLSVRDKALEAAMRLMAEAKARRENRVEIAETEKGYQITCHISGGEMELMSVSLYAPDWNGAKLIERNFYQNPEAVYRLLLSSLTGDETYARAYFAERE
ncbi:DUF4364 family protein [uncultured Neglectibacter sp.]|uniref:DUF4364 family protein n=1 Tax=uncultured Neglectibacter sp. TaxID=1924108 RepID=UPI0034DEAF57